MTNVKDSFQVPSSDLGMTRDQAKQVLAQFESASHLRKRGLIDLIIMYVRGLLEKGEVLEQAARRCGVSAFRLRLLLKAHPDLLELARENRIKHNLERFSQVFKLVEYEGISVHMACRKLGVPCHSGVYAIARSALAYERFPRLKLLLCNTHSDNGVTPRSYEKIIRK